MHRHLSYALQYGRIVTFPDLPFRRFRVTSCYWDKSAEAYLVCYVEVR